MRGELFFHARHQRGSGITEASRVDLQHHGHEETAFAELHPFEMPDMRLAIMCGKPVRAAMAFAQILDDRAAFGDAGAAILDERRFAERMRLLEFGGREIGFGIALVGHDVVIRAQLFQQPEYPLRAAVVEVMDGNRHGSSPIRRFARTLGRCRAPVASRKAEKPVRPSSGAHRLSVLSGAPGDSPAGTPARG